MLEGSVLLVVDQVDHEYNDILDHLVRSLQAKYFLDVGDKDLRDDSLEGRVAQQDRLFDLFYFRLCLEDGHAGGPLFPGDVQV